MNALKITCSLFISLGSVRFSGGRVGCASAPCGHSLHHSAAWTFSVLCANECLKNWIEHYFKWFSFSNIPASFWLVVDINRKYLHSFFSVCWIIISYCFCFVFPVRFLLIDWITTFNAAKVNKRWTTIACGIFNPFANVRHSSPQRTHRFDDVDACVESE